MKLCLITLGLIVMLVTVTVQATTLKLSSELDLLVLDRHKISGSLLKGADGLKLESGEHQLLFRIERKHNPVTSATVDWISLPQIVTFIACGREVTIKYQFYKLCTIVKFLIKILSSQLLMNGAMKSLANTID